ncbi:hypothetical protein [uncultured Mediterranean phage uvMED]|nr:hypothetical protein [uncultured Mediterranean phage uvMED]
MAKAKKFKQGESGNPKGRKKGEPNKITKVTRETLAFALKGSTLEIKSALAEVRERSAKEYIDCIVKLLPYVTPKLLAAQINEEQTHKIEINLSQDTTATDLKKMLGESDESVEDIDFENL